MIALGASVLRSLAVSTAAGMLGAKADAVIAGEALARAAFDDSVFSHEPATDPGVAFAALGLTAISVDGLVSRTAEETAMLDSILAGAAA